MATGGFLPLRDHMAVIVRAACELYRVARQWQKHVQLPGYPVEMGNLIASEALFKLERTLNPGCLAWENESRKVLKTQCWATEVSVGLAWLRNLLDLVFERNQLQSLVSEACWETWLAKERSIPDVVSISDDELTALGQAIRMLPRPKSLPLPLPSHAAMGDSGHGQLITDTAEETPLPVILIGPRVSPWVLGKPKSKLTTSQFRVVKALVEAGDKGLKMAALKKISGSGDAVNVLKRLASSDPEWKAVIWLPGKTRMGYRIGYPDAYSLTSQNAPVEHALTR